MNGLYIYIMPVSTWEIHEPGLFFTFPKAAAHGSVRVTYVRKMAGTATNLQLQCRAKNINQIKKKE
jgi:hypothetical protein